MSLFSVDMSPEGRAWAPRASSETTVRASCESCMVTEIGLDSLVVVVVVVVVRGEKELDD